MKCFSKLVLSFTVATTLLLNTTVSKAYAIGENEHKGSSLPSVQEYTIKSKDKWKLTASSRIFVIIKDGYNLNDNLEETIKLLNSEFAAVKKPSSEVMPIVYGAETEIKDGDIVIEKAEITETTNEEGYKIEISSHAKVTAQNEKGILYGVRTLMQYLIVNDSMEYGTIVDYPDIRERSFHIDIARKFYTKDWIIKQIKDMSWMKLNTLQLHFSENEGFRIQCDSHPEVMSKDYLTKEEVKEILAIAKQYKISVIPSLDSPGHLTQALKTHPELQLPKASYGYSSKEQKALNIALPEARRFVKDLIDEYAELFYESKYFHIGADEFIDFNKFYQYPILEKYAKDNLGENYGGIDTYIDYINDIASYVEGKGFTARAWNDGLYRYDETQRVKLKKSIEITYWTKWDRNMATVKKFLDNGHNIVNFNDSYFYYVLGENAGYKYPTGKKIFEGWTPGAFPWISRTEKQDIEKPYPNQLLGASFAIWSDTPKAQTLEEVKNGIREPLRAMAEKSWNANKNTKTYEEFKTNFDKLGYAPGFNTELPKAADIVKSDKLGKVIIKYVNENGDDISKDETVYGVVGDNYEVKARKLYGYKVESIPNNTKGTFSKEAKEIKIVYKLYADKSNLQNEVDNALKEEEYIKTTFEKYKEALEKGKVSLKDSAATQKQLDEAILAINKGKEGLIHISKAELYELISNTLDKDDYLQESYSKYQESIEEGKKILTKIDTTEVEINNSVNTIKVAKKNLISGPFITITANKGVWKDSYTKYDLSRALDGDESTFLWIEGAQEVNDYFQFKFRNTIDLSGIKIISTGAKTDVINSADVQASIDGKEWKTVGKFGNNELVQLNFNKEEANYARILITKSTDKWSKINEVSFIYTINKNDLNKKIEEAKEIKKGNYTNESYQALQLAISSAEDVMKNENATKDEINDGVAKLEEAINSLKKEEVNLNELLSTIDLANTKLEVNYSKDTWNDFKKFYDLSITTPTKKDVTQDEVNEVNKNLRDAINMLVDISELKAKVNEGKKLNEIEYTKESFKVFKNSLKEAESSLDNSAIKKEDINILIENLNNTIEGLEKVVQAINDKEVKVVSEDNRIKVVDESNNIKTVSESKEVAKINKYEKKAIETPKVQTYKTFLAVSDENKSETENNNDKIIEENIARSVVIISNKEKEVEKEVKSVNKKELEKEIKESEKYSNKAEEYEKKSFEEFLKALNEATKINDDKDSIQEKVDKSLEVLKKSIKALKKKPEDENARVKQEKTFEIEEKVTETKNINKAFIIVPVLIIVILIILNRKKIISIIRKEK